LSTLTKVLIILLTIASIFLCGIVVTYVANAVNYKQKYDGLDEEYQAAKENEENARDQFNELKNLTDEEKLKLGNEIAALEVQVGQSETKLEEAERQKALLDQKLANFASIVEGFTKTNDQQGLLLKNTFDELNKVQTELIKERKELKETTTALIEKMAVIALLEDKSKRLIEEKTDLQGKLDQLLGQFGKAVAAPRPVTAVRDRARMAPVTRDIGLKGLITVVDMKNSLVEISIGAADGVKENMRFHATRGDKFICDIVILDVDTEKAVGFLDLVKNQPQAGDKISTNL
jgi:hypothetical protein